jgi:methylated-DNA-protein-cysteine methyltransferase-like protein
MKKGREPNFFKRVYHVVRMIPRGQVATYGQIATIVSHPQAARTVGWALRALKADTDVPWHRVINARGQISTAYREHGASVQRMLLEREQVRFDQYGQIDLAEFQWPGLDWPEIEALRQEWEEKPPSQNELGGERPWRESNPRHMV